MAVRSIPKITLIFKLTVNLFPIIQSIAIPSVLVCHVTVLNINIIKGPTMA